MLILNRKIMLLYSQDPNFNPDLLKRTEQVEKDYQKTLKGFEISKKNPAECLKRWMWMFKHPNQLLVFSHNEYPYNLPEGQSQWLLWVKPQINDNDFTFKQGIVDYIICSFSKNKVFAIWQNEPEKQTIKDLTHFHFILLD